MKIEHCRYFGQDGESHRRMIIILDEKQLVDSPEYKTNMYNEIFDVLCDIQDILLEEASENKKLKKEKKDINEWGL